MFNKLLVLVAVLAMPLCNQQLYSECVYIEPTKTTKTDTFFQEIISQSNSAEETFQTVRSFFDNEKQSVHQFKFKYPLKDKDHAEIFFRTMEIKAQEAHRFVPVFSDCQFLYPAHLGFMRKAVITDGPIIWEHTLVDKKTKSILFIEEKELLPNGQQIPGCFAALNTILEEDGKWYFSGVYLYLDKPSQEEIEEREQVFLETYENMLTFINNGHVDSAYKQLK